MYRSISAAIRGWVVAQPSSSYLYNSQKAVSPTVNPRPSRFSSGQTLNHATATMAALRMT